jgi:hypothetical protein
MHPGIPGKKHLHSPLCFWFAYGFSQGIHMQLWSHTMSHNQTNTYQTNQLSLKNEGKTPLT